MQYSAVIRTIGNEEYLLQTINSLNAQNLAPSEIVIILPIGTNVAYLDNMSMRGVKVFHSEKGMIAQRLSGIKRANQRFVLLLDDDIIFHSKDATQKLIGALTTHCAQCVVPHYPDDHKEGRIYKILQAIFFISRPSGQDKLTYNRAGGYIYPDHPPTTSPQLTEGGRGACIAVDRDWLISENLLKPNVLHQTKYALRDDGIFILDIVRKNGNAIMIGNIELEHIGIAHRIDSDRLYAINSASIFNNYVFWKDYIYSKFRYRALSMLCFSWFIVGQLFFGVLRSVKHRKYRPLAGFLEGLRMTLNYEREQRKQAKR